MAAARVVLIPCNTSALIYMLPHIINSNVLLHTNSFLCCDFVFQSAAKMIKDTMDKKFGASWHAVVGESYGFEVTHELKNLLYMFFGGNIAIILWKCSWCLFSITFKKNISADESFTYLAHSCFFLKNRLYVHISFYVVQTFLYAAPKYDFARKDR